MVKYGFTGSQHGTTDEVIEAQINKLQLTKKDTVITGACIGVDSQVSHYIKKHYPYIEQLIIVPFDKKKVDTTVYDNGEVIYMPSGTTYRDRNITIVKNSNVLIAFWNGQKAYSGTFMTMNIAHKYNIPLTVVNING